MCLCVYVEHCVVESDLRFHHFAAFCSVAVHVLLGLAMLQCRCSLPTVWIVYHRAKGFRVAGCLPVVRCMADQLCRGSLPML